MNEPTDATSYIGISINLETYTHGASCCVWSVLDGINMEHVSRAPAIWIARMCRVIALSEFIWGEGYPYLRKNNLSAGYTGNNHRRFYPTPIWRVSETFRLFLPRNTIFARIRPWKEKRRGGKAEKRLKISFANKSMRIKAYYGEICSLNIWNVRSITAGKQVDCFGWQWSRIRNTTTKLTFQFVICHRSHVFITKNVRTWPLVYFKCLNI